MTAANRIPLGIETDAGDLYNQKPNKRERKLLEAMREDLNINVTFKQPVVYGLRDTAGVALASTDAAGVAIPAIIDGVQFERVASVVNGTASPAYLLPYVSADGLELPVDADVANGVTAYELGHGVLARSPAVYTVGSFPGGKSIFLEADILIDDISDLDQLMVGWRKREAYQVDPNDYDELAALHVGETGATVEDGRISVMKILNNAATSFTDTATTDWADAAQKKLRVEVANNGVCTFSIAGTVTNVASHTFDSGEVLIPFLYIDNATGSTTGDPGVTVVSWSCGLK